MEYPTPPRQGTCIRSLRQALDALRGGRGAKALGAQGMALGVGMNDEPSRFKGNYNRDHYIIHLNIALQMVVSLYLGGKSHVSNGQHVSFKEPCTSKRFIGLGVGMT